MLGKRYALVFKNDGIDIDGLFSVLSDFGAVNEIHKEKEWTAFILTSTLSEWLKLKLAMSADDLKLVEDKETKGIYYPMEA